MRIHHLLTPLLLLLLLAAAPTAVSAADDASASAEPAATEAPADTAAAPAADEAPAGAEEAGDATQTQESESGSFTFQLVEFVGKIIEDVLKVLLVGVLIWLVIEMVLIFGKPLSPGGMRAKAEKLWQAGDYDNLHKLAKSNSSGMAKLIGFCAENPEVPFDVANDNAADIVSREVDKKHALNYWLAVFATIGPLLGLLGTVAGMIDAFRVVALAGDIGDTSMVAEGIYKALFTTLFGLVIAILALVVFNIVKTMINRLGTNFEEECATLVNHWFGSKKQEA